MLTCHSARTWSTIVRARPNSSQQRSFRRGRRQRGSSSRRLWRWILRSQERMQPTRHRRLRGLSSAKLQQPSRDVIAGLTDEAADAPGRDLDRLIAWRCPGATRVRRRPSRTGWTATIGLDRECGLHRAIAVCDRHVIVDHAATADFMSEIGPEADSAIRASQS